MKVGLVNLYAIAVATNSAIGFALAYFSTGAGGLERALGLVPLLAVCAISIPVLIHRLPRLRLEDLVYLSIILIGILGALLSNYDIGVALATSAGSIVVWLLLRITTHAFIRSQPDIERVVAVLNVFHLALGVLCVTLVFRVGELISKELGGDATTNLVAANFYVGAMGAVYFLWTRRQSALSAALLVASVGAMVVGLTRGAWLATAVSSLVFFGLETISNRKAATSRLAGSVLVVFPIVGTALFIVVTLYGFGEAIEYYATKGLSGRGPIWYEGWLLWQANFWFGIGLGNSWSEIAPHSTLLRYAIDTGATGVGLYVLFLLMVPIRMLRVRSRSLAPHERTRRNVLVALCVGMIMLQAFDTYILFGPGIRGFMLSFVYVLSLTWLRLATTRAPSRAQTKTRAAASPDGLTAERGFA